MPNAFKPQKGFFGAHQPVIQFATNNCKMDLKRTLCLPTSATAWISAPASL